MDRRPRRRKRYKDRQPLGGQVFVFVFVLMFVLMFVFVFAFY